MSYLAAVQRAARGLSDVVPRALSRYEQPGAEWELSRDAPEPVPTPAETPNPPSPLRPPRADEHRTDAAPLQAGQPEAPAPALPVAETRHPSEAPRPAAAALGTAAPAEHPAEAARAVAELRSAPHPASERPQPDGPDVRIEPSGEDRFLYQHEIRTERDVRIEAAPASSGPPEPQPSEAAPQLLSLVPRPEVAVPEAAAPSPAAPPPEPPGPAPIVIEIGQIDIHLEAPARAAPSVPARRREAPVLSLDDYLKGRT